MGGFWEGGKEKKGIPQAQNLVSGDLFLSFEATGQAQCWGQLLERSLKGEGGNYVCAPIRMHAA